MYKYEVKVVIYFFICEISKVFKIWYKFFVILENNVIKFKFKLNGIFFISIMCMIKFENIVLVIVKLI